MKELQTTYTDYFKSLSEQHIDLLHSDENGQQAFFSIDIEETLNAFRSGVKEQGNALYLIEYDIEYVEETVEYNCGFVVMGYVGSGDIVRYLQTKSKCEQITKDILARMRKDSTEGHELFKRSLNTLSGVRSSPYNYVADPNYAGQITFFKLTHAVRCSYNAEKFN